MLSRLSPIKAALAADRPADRERVRDILVKRGVYLDEGPYPPDLAIPPAVRALDLRLPFRRGTRVLVGQGHNSMVARATHRPGNLRYALDFGAVVPGLPIDAASYPAAFVRGTPVVASAAGTAYVYGNARENEPDNWGYGNIVLIDHGDGYASLYAHLQDVRVVTQQRLSAGAHIASIGATGRAFHPHLHFQVVQLLRTPTPLVDQRTYVGRYLAPPPWRPAGVPFLLRTRDVTAGMPKAQRISSFDIRNAEHGHLWNEAHVYEAP